MTVFYGAAKSAGADLITGHYKHYPQEAFILTPAEFLKLQMCGKREKPHPGRQGGPNTV
jgi:hypothetical protein